MCRTGIFRFGIGNWIFLLAIVHLFTYAQGAGAGAGAGGEDAEDEGIRVVTEPADAVVGAGERALLACAMRVRGGAGGARAVRVAWRHSAAAAPTREHVLQTTDKHRKQLSNGSLSIEGMSAALAGRYQCVGSVEGVGSVVSRVAIVMLAELPQLTSAPRSVLAAVGGPALLPCRMHVPPRVALRVVAGAGAAGTTDRRVYGAGAGAGAGAARLHSTPAPPVLRVNVTWLKNGSPLSLGLESARVSLTPSGALELDPVRAHDAATYRCRVALYSAPNLYATSEEMELRVSSEESAESPPRFIATPQPVTVVEGASVTFDCAAAGSPRPEIVWLNNGVAIDLSDLDSRFYLAGAGSLRVQAARALDAGAYTCRAHNRLDSADVSAALSVLTAPRVSIPGGRAVVARVRGDVTLRCEARGRPAPTVQWLKDGEPLTPNNHDIALVDQSSLRIQGVLPVDAGMFQCVAASAGGGACATVRLHVLPGDDELVGHETPSNPNSLSLPTSSTPFHNQTNPNPAQDIFNSLISSNPLDPDQNLDLNQDFLGETSSAYTSGPEDYVDTYDNEESDQESYVEDLFHAYQGLDLDLLRANGSATPATPAPRGLRAVIVKHRFVTLSWQEPELKDEVTGYAVIYSVKGSDRERVSRGGPQRREMNIASLQPNTTYQFAALAYTKEGVSVPTQVIEVTTPAEEVTFGPPMHVRAEATGPHSVRVTWAPPAGTLAPDKYTVTYTEVESGREQVHLVASSGASGASGASGTPTSTVLSNMRAATEYVVRVAAAGGGGAAGEARVRTRSDAPAAPPGNVTATPTGPTTILVRWEAPPARTHRGPLTGYKVRYRPVAADGAGGAGGAGAAGGARRKADSLTTAADTRRVELTHLEPGQQYQIRVCAINANGSGPFSEWVACGTVRGEQDERSVPPPPPPLTTRAGRDWISVWWEDDASSAVVVRGYWLGWGLGVPDERVRELPRAKHSHVISALEPNSEYVISLRASNSQGLGPAVYATVRTKPATEGDEEEEDEEGGEGDEGGEGGDDEEDEEDSPPLIPPVGVKVIMLSGTTAVVYWTDPTLPKGQGATDGRRYVVRYAAVAGGGGGRARYFNATEVNCMLDELRPFTLYEFAVKLIKGGRESAWSMLVSNTTLEAPPGAPRELRAAPGAPPARAADLAWAPPAKPNGLITGYVIMYAAQRASGGGGGEEWTAVAVPGDRTHARVERLRPRTTYSFKVQARNSRGAGPASAPVAHSTATETGGEGGGLATATSAWLWASAGGACAVLALAAALALSLCCRRQPHSPQPDTSTYQKSSASAAIKPPDLWIHHDQMELKRLDKSAHTHTHTHSEHISASSAEGNALVSSTLTLGRAPPVEYEPARRPPPASLDRRHYVPTYVEHGAGGCAGGYAGGCAGAGGSLAGSDDTATLRASPAGSAAYKCDRCDYAPMTGVSVGSLGNMGSMSMGGTLGGMSGTLGGMSAGCASTCERRPHARTLHPDQSTPLLAGVAPLPLGSPQAAVAPLAPLAPLAPRQPCGVGACGACSGAGAGTGAGAGLAGDCSVARERGHYVAYEPLGHYTHRDSLSSDTGLASTAGAGRAPLHSFSDGSDHSTPTHSSRSIRERECSPYKKSASSSPGHIPNRLQLGGGGGAVAHCPAELEPLTPSRSTERLHREMQNLEGLMKDLSAITQHQFHC